MINIQENLPAICMIRKDPHSLINNKVNAILEDSKGNFWVGTAGDGLHTMDRATGKFERHLYDPAHPEKLSRPPVNQVNEVLTTLHLSKKMPCKIYGSAHWQTDLTRYDSQKCRK